MSKLIQRLLSDENIFLSIHLVDSYIQNKELLSPNERKELNRLKDIFNYKKINTTINKVRSRLNNILSDESEFFEAKVFFKPKKIDDEGKNIFRPLHTASLIDQIAMIGMLQVLVYDIDVKTGKLVPSELSRLLPSNFYGNRISFDGMRLFKPWQEQYQEYTSKANDILYECSETFEYKYEVSLDLENFFPSINPQVLFNFFTKHLPLQFKKIENKTLHTILKKLLIFRLTPLNINEVSWYMQCDMEELEGKLNSIKYAKGMPQGLPHTYFMANIFMLMIQEKYKMVFPGEMLFYVDDSVIFTNGTKEDITSEIFIKSVKKINHEISVSEQSLLKDKTNWILPKDYSYNEKDYGVHVHSAENQKSKSVFSHVPDAKKNSGELYLKSLSRETSNMGFDISTIFSDAEVQMISSRTNAIYKAISKEINKLDKKDSTKKVYYDKLLRYKKFFSYRKTLIDYKNNGNIIELKERVLSDIRLRNSDELDTFYEMYNDDILAANIQFVFKRCTEESVDTRDLINAVKQLNKMIYGKNIKNSYILQSYRPYLESKPERYSVDYYYSLKNIIAAKFNFLREQSEKQKNEWIKNNLAKLCQDNYEELILKLELKKFFAQSIYVRNSSSNIERMIINAVYSYIFEYEIDDNVTFCKKNRTPIQYSEIRVLTVLRNRVFSIDDFLNNLQNYLSDEYQETCDYYLLQVVDAFKIFVRSPKRIDELILIHKYCCDTWKNGSKYLHFYTLHNQEHAISLIKSSIQLLHAISYFKIKQIDYFVLFAACYLHDVSMVTLPDSSNFFATNDESANCIYTEFIDDFAEVQYNSTKTKKLLCETYHKIDDFFENKIRSNHAGDSAKEIRKFPELDFIEPAMRELVAKVSNGHGYDTADVYYVKSVGKKSLVNEKFITIILRLSDLLDMSRYRISNVVLNHNLENLTPVSRFHWISHLLTEGYELETIYDISNIKNSGENIGELLQNGSISERIQLTVNVLMNQTTEATTEKKCKFISNSEFIHNSEQPIILATCDKDEECNNQKCNFMCKWFVSKNDYLFQELSALKEYLTNVPDNFFRPEISVCICSVSNTGIPNDIFDYLRDYVENQ